MMKKAVVLFYILILSGKLIGQPCRQVEIATDSTKVQILRDFISESVKNRYFLNDKGVVKLKVYQDAMGHTRWYLSPMIDDRYKDNPPTKFADFNKDIVLIYDADSLGRELKTTGNLSEIINCLEEKIGDRVYLRPETNERWTSEVFTTPNGTKIRRGQRRSTTGSGGAKIVIFEEDGTYETLIPL